MLLVIFDFSLSTSSEVSRNINYESFNYFPIISAVNVSAVKEHVEYLAKLGTRATGYEGNELAARYIYNKFLEYGLENVSYEYFSVVDCLSYGANVTVLPDGPRIKIHPLVPNLVSPSTTPPEGITGKLVYVEDGNLEDFKGKDIEGNIVIMNWDSEDNWLNAAKFGAKAVIFLPPKYLSYSLYGVASYEARSPGPITKCLWDIPLNFPRFYVEEPAANSILKYEGHNVRLISTQRWEKVTAKNVIGFIKGVKKPEGIITLSSYFDSYSIVPTVAPGAQESIGISSLLELAKYLANERPPVTVMVVAFGGHHQALAGAISMASEYHFPAPNETKKAMGTRMWRLYNLDLSTGSDYVLMTHEGAMIPKDNIYKSIINPPGPFGEETVKYAYDLNKYLDELNKDPSIKRAHNAYIKLGYSWNEGPATGGELFPILMPAKLFAYDHEPWGLIGPAGWTFTTAHDSRPSFWTPFDTIEKINWENLRVQLECIYALLLRSLKECLIEFNPSFKFYPGSHNNWPTNVWEWKNFQHWPIVTGKVAVWKEDRAFWESLKRSDLGNLTNPIVVLRGVRPFDRRFFFADDEGKFTITGALYSGESMEYKVSAWVLNPITGNVAFAPDMGPHRYPMVSQIVSERSPYNDLGLLTLFNASTLAILDLVHPTYFENLKDASSILVYESGTGISPQSYGIWIEEGICIVAFPPNTPVEVDTKDPVTRYPYITLANGTDANPLGWGFKLKPYEQRIERFPFLQYAKDFYYLNTERLQILGRYITIAKSPLYLAHLENGELIQDIQAALNEKNFDKAYALAIESWKSQNEIYLYSRKSLEDAAFVIPFFAALILPFIVLAEKLLFDFKGYKKVISLVGIAISLMSALFFLHPGFQIAANATSIIIGFSVLVLSAPILLIIVSQAGALMKEFRIKAVGRHEVDVSRSGQAFHVFSTSIENMKKRRFRTILIMISIIIMASSIVDFISIGATRTPASFSVGPEQGMPLYEGIYIHKLKWGRGDYGIDKPVIDYIKGKFGDQALVIPRAWKYTLWPTVREISVGFTVTQKGERLEEGPKALLGLTPEESLLWNIDSCLLSGRWFVPGERHVCILSENMAKALNIKSDNLPATITIEDVPLKVIGIIRKDLQSVKDLHEEITPIRMDLPGEMNPWNEHVTLDEIMIMTYKDVVSLGGTVASVSIKPFDRNLVRSIAYDLYKTLPDLMIYSNFDGKIVLQRQGFDITVRGVESQIVPLAIVILTIFNLMLSSVYERKREISIYSAVGLSPVHISILFMTETIVYGIIGAIIGYMVAILEMKYLGLIGVWLELNYSSSMVIFALGLTILVVVISNVYPSWLSSRLVTPSLERAWKVPTSPQGNIWNIPLPFIASSKSEATGIIKYLHEFMAQHMHSDAPIFRITNLRTVKGEIEERYSIELSSDCHLEPYNLGISQKLDILAIQEKPERWVFTTNLTRIGGSINEWERLNRGLINKIREQILLWRTLPEDEKTRYMD